MYAQHGCRGGAGSAVPSHPRQEQQAFTADEIAEMVVAARGRIVRTASGHPRFSGLTPDDVEELFDATSEIVVRRHEDYTDSDHVGASLWTGMELRARDLFRRRSRRGADADPADAGLPRGRSRGPRRADLSGAGASARHRLPCRTRPGGGRRLAARPRRRALGRRRGATPRGQPPRGRGAPRRRAAKARDVRGACPGRPVVRPASDGHRPDARGGRRRRDPSVGRSPI